MQNQALSGLFSVHSDSPPLCISTRRNGLQIAVGTSSSCILLDAKTGRRIFEAGGSEGPVTATAFAGGGHLLVGAAGALRLWDTDAGRELAFLPLLSDVEQDSKSNGAVHLAAQPEGKLFAAASEDGRKVYLVNEALVVERELDLRASCGRLSELSWLSSTVLLAVTAGGVQSWACNCGSSQPCLTLGHSIGIVSARTSPDQSTLAAGSRDGVVYLWSVAEGGPEQSDEALSAELRSTLKDYTDQVHLLRWDSTGRYLASMDGSETTIWDVQQLLQQSVQSTICCGHEPDSQILCAAFQADGPVLATGGSDGKVLFYNSAAFQPGQHSQPCAAAQYIPQGDGITCIAWLPGGQLVAGTQSGKVIGWQLQPAAFDEAPPAEAASQAEPLPGPPDAGAPRLQHERREAGAHAAEPAVANGFGRRGGAKGGTKGGRLDPGGGSGGRFGRGGRLLRDGSSGDLPAERHMSMPNTRGTRELAEKLRADNQAAADGSHDRAEVGRSTSLQDGSAQPLGRRATSLERQQLSPSLMQHIQRVQQKPSASNRQREPAGWGMGSPAAASPASPQVPYGQPAGAVPYNAAGHVPGAMQAGYMMMPNQASAMGHQGMMPYGFPPGVAPVPMMAHAGSAQQGIVGSGSLPGLSPGMVYMPVGASAVPQQPWQMVQPPWLGGYYLHPSQRLPDNMNIMSAGRSASAPEGPLGFNWAGRPLQTPGGFQANGREYLTKSAISLPTVIDSEWRSSQATAAASRSEMSEEGAIGAEPAAAAPGALKRRTPASAGDGPPLASPATSASISRDGGRSSGESHTEPNGRAPATNRSPAPQHASDSAPAGDDALAATESGSPVVTVYVGNLPPTVDEVALMVPFSYFGNVTNIQVIRDKNSLQSRGFAFVSYAQPVFAATAIQSMNGRILYGSFRGRALKVGPSNRVI